MFNYNYFKEMLIIGQKAEDEAIKRINKPVIRRQDETNYKIMHHDIETDDNIKYEVKLDRQSTRTGNIFIEYEDGRGYKSGIDISDANYYIIVSNDIYYMIDIDELRKLIKKCNKAQAKDGTKGYLLKVNILSSNSKII
jgi:hypothetical protein